MFNKSFLSFFFVHMAINRQRLWSFSNTIIFCKKMQDRCQLYLYLICVSHYTIFVTKIEFFICCRKYHTNSVIIGTCFFFRLEENVLLCWQTYRLSLVRACNSTDSVRLASVFVELSKNFSWHKRSLRF